MTLQELRDQKGDRIRAIAAKHGVTAMRVFGSFARGEAGPDSDLDLLIEAGPVRTPFFPGGLVVDLEEALGMRIDVTTQAALHPMLLNDVLREAVPFLKSDLLYIEHILDCIQRIEEYTGGPGGAESARDAFMRSHLIQDAVIRNLQVLAESAGRISPENQAREPEVPWQQVRAFRNVLVHQYLGVDVEFVWSVITDDLPLLREKALQLRDYLSEAE